MIAPNKLSYRKKILPQGGSDHVTDFSINNQYHILNALKDSNPLLRDKQ